MQGWVRGEDTKPNKIQVQNVGGISNPNFKGQGNLDFTGIGGLVFVESVNENKSMKVDLLITLDILDSYSGTEISSNVFKSINYYQTKDIYGG
ncbi:hypothetical protein SD427_12100 [Chryseobacterium sp. JJR-5R]|uniref:hypothetical protein n=1 Tax=Chryseobacterium sp. JJR-5R TaxID=3093923 RepID=UPI002A763780|nr:hypothetical protein [Chryseobacterium sp. JJR-5R]WPO81504.1 hypothetical protein SD427_12100 [Chryseobacterium sp. JJR-5R]